MYRGHSEKSGTQALQGSDPGATIVDLDRRSQDPLSKQAEPLRSAPSYELFSWPQPASARSQASGEFGPRTSIGRNTSSGQPGPCARGRFRNSAIKGGRYPLKKGNWPQRPATGNRRRRSKESPGEPDHGFRPSGTGVPGPYPILRRASFA
jgi:hypothetical protein